MKVAIVKFIRICECSINNLKFQHLAHTQFMKLYIRGIKANYMTFGMFHSRTLVNQIEFPSFSLQNNY